MSIIYETKRDLAVATKRQELDRIRNESHGHAALAGFSLAGWLTSETQSAHHPQRKWLKPLGIALGIFGSLEVVMTLFTGAVTFFRGRQLETMGPPPKVIVLEDDTNLASDKKYVDLVTSKSSPHPRTPCPTP